MQINVKRVNKEFHPITVEITLQSEQELHCLRHVTGWASVAVNAVEDYGKADDLLFEKHPAEHLLLQVYDSLKEID